ncbi:MAG: L-2-hydroxyglutarate oxidase [Bacteroidota bacterium]|nr:L-2-hydroxyglutarate oxidase [Bacteroidota bacterium]MDX5431139.1 L-2-hydroxyglutarate oxidase [Bacteroidota bacterium]MDX5469886.1 L-2-hydroxyglutarate oxidase [Bacteroidota bacterium]
MHYDIIIGGGGIVGLATAYRILEKNPKLKLAVLEKEGKIAAHQTGHNSGVIHSGIYYKPGSLKAQNCIQGYHDLIAFAQKHSIPHELCGKIIVATRQEEVPAMEKVLERGIANGLDGLIRLNAEQLHEYEPHVKGVAGIYVPQTGIIDYKVVAAKYAEEIQAMGGNIFLDTKIEGLRRKGSNTEVITQGTTYETSLFVNCGGLMSDRIARMNEKDLDVRIVPFRGEYYMLKEEKKSLVKNLIYPVPDPNFPFLGVHFTRMIGGEVEAGPNAVFAFKREGYHRSDFDWKDFSESISWKGFRKVAFKYWKTGLGEFYRSYSKAAFTKALQGLIPEVQEEDLIPAGAGVRAQACSREGGLVDDFMFSESAGIIHVLNAPSPAATSSLAIGSTISEKALAQLK